MRKIVVTQYMSLDGVVEDPSGSEGSAFGGWTRHGSRGPEGDTFKLEELFASDVLLFGRVSYDGFAAAWPTIQDGMGFADRINPMPKYVVSAKGKVAEWTNSTTIRENVVDEIKALKQQGDGDILVYGSPTLVETLVQHDLVDEHRIMLYPVVVGEGKKLFADGAKSILNLIESRLLGPDIVLLRYGRAST
jgi:dihydrofolate reductase